LFYFYFLIFFIFLYIVFLQAPLSVRRPFEELLPLFDSVLMGFREEWGGVDNDRWVLDAAGGLIDRHPHTSSLVLKLPPDISVHDKYWIACQRRAS
jgi:hypothetical protein